MSAGNGNQETSPTPERIADPNPPGSAEDRPVEEGAPAPGAIPQGTGDQAARFAGGAQAGPGVVPPAGGWPPPPGGRASGWLRRHRVLAGILAGLAALILLGGMFAIGYAVGRPDQEKPAPAPPGYEVPWRQARPFRSYPQPRQKMENLSGKVDILRQARDELLELAASELGMTTAELEDRMEEGKTLADLAEEKGLSSEELVSKLASRIGEIADRLASEGTITTSQAEAVKSRAEAMASLFVHGGLRALRRNPWR